MSLIALLYKPESTNVPEPPQWASLNVQQIKSNKIEIKKDLEMEGDIICRNISSSLVVTDRLLAKTTIFSQVYDFAGNHQITVRFAVVAGVVTLSFTDQAHLITTNSLLYYTPLQELNNTYLPYEEIDFPFWVNNAGNTANPHTMGIVRITRRGEIFIAAGVNAAGAIPFTSNGLAGTYGNVSISYINKVTIPNL